LSIETAVGAVEVVEVFPLLELVVEELGVVDHDAVEHPVELLGIDAVGALDFAVRAWCSGLDVDVADAAVEEMPVECALELGAVVGLDDLDTERQFLEDVVEELDGGLLVVAGVDPVAPVWIALMHKTSGDLVQAEQLLRDHLASDLPPAHRQYLRELLSKHGLGHLCEE
jgi:hypothetical protein